jgi:hypothetical protein
MAEMSNEELLAALREQAKPKKTIVGEIAANGGGAVAGGYIGYVAGSALALVAAPFTGGLSLVIPPLLGVGGAVYGHQMGKKVDD